jgi:hypothetical protein
MKRAAHDCIHVPVGSTMWGHNGRGPGPAGWLALRAERRRYEQVTLAEQGPLVDATAVGMLVALHGRPALEMLTGTAPADPVPSEPMAPNEEKSASPLTPRRLML